ncbi:Cytosine/adenosine deaminase [Frankineae bacterium MT45]|nr:Cytosine/adenosine deaminase [Frankineae bacterium MT45]
MIVIEGAHIVTGDAAGREYRSGHLVLQGTRILAVGPAAAPREFQEAIARGEATRIDGAGRLVTAGFVNAHHHLNQWITRGYATDTTLFGWLTTLYPIWARLDADSLYASAAANLGWLALTGCTTSMDHQYVYPSGVGDLLEAEITAARDIGLRFHPTRGSMNLGQSDGGLPPDSVVETMDAILDASAAAIDRWHDPAFDAMTRIALAPCSPFSVTGELMRESAQLARERGVRLHTHVSETLDEEAFCLEKFGLTPPQYLESLGWLGADVWLAHCVHLSDEAVSRFAATGTGVAHCPTSNGRLGSGAAPIRALLDAGGVVGLGVDGAASNESGRMVDELHQALLVARVRDGELALNAREALALATMGGARCLGRQEELGSLEAGKLADVAIWRVDDLPGAGIEDPVVTLVIGATTLDRLYVNGRPVVAGGELLTADVETLATNAAAAAAAVRPASGGVPWT